ncbi:SDR family oxidoreductase [Streptomyces sp. PTM05]|uniref:SDR family oxidoreductase n=1 Tax=Streptantibioticus parmotrematis TaxID=2873249 RepID=A0ABS7QS23_9ACTN|nr:NAD(P)-binding oxidoreductase [Streptantibioticus parmotrematis]MBY8885987.1 SDR family oxidoreductase [Streptantibioticus parmotrematis]
MRLLVLGATGPTGRRIVDQALAAGDRVTAFVRDPARLPATGHADALTVHRGDATRRADVAAAAEGVDAVLVALGSGNSVRSDIASRSTAALIPALGDAGVDRVVMLSAYGVGETAKDAGLVMRAAYRIAMRSLFDDKAKADAALRASPLAWTLVYPVTLTNGPLTGRYRVAPRLRGGGVPRISRADVADFMLAEARHPAWVGRTAVLGGRG